MRYVTEHIRIVYHHSPTHDVTVEVMKNGQWTVMRTYNEISDDYAHTNAREYAESLKQDWERT